MRQFDGKVALISGAARGQGRSHAIRLAEEGADIIGFDIVSQVDSVEYAMATPDDLEETRKLVEKTGQRMLAHEADVRDAAAVQALVDAGVAELGRIDIVLANAGIITYGAATDLTLDQWDDTIGINLTGVWYTIRAALPTMISAGAGGSIIITGSFAGLRGPANALGYVAAKHGVVGVMSALANELGPHRIRVNAIHPTTVDTEMVSNATTYRLFRPDLEEPTREDCIEALSSMQALPIPNVEVSDISNAVVWLASESARYVTGINLPIDGGAANR